MSENLNQEFSKLNKVVDYTTKYLEFDNIKLSNIILDNLDRFESLEIVD